MVKVRWLTAGLCLLAVAAPAVSQQRGQYEDRDSRDSRYDRDGRDRGDNRYDRDDRSRDDRSRGDRDDRRGNWRPGGNQPIPGGSWAQSCRRSSMAGNTLTAQCKDQRGKWRDTRINPRTCQTGRVGNRFGQLACE
jgi:hypothetical protein